MGNIDKNLTAAVSVPDEFDADFTELSHFMSLRIQAWSFAQPEKADNVARNHSKHVKPLVQRNRLHELCLCCHTKIKGPDNPTNQLLPMITSRCENEMGKAGRKGDGARQVGSVKEVCVCVTVLCVCVSLCM